MNIKEVKITSISNNCDGVGILNGKKIFISKASVNDIVKCKVIKENKNFYIGKIIEITQKSNDRLENITCPYYDNCGGCNLLHLKEDKYIEIKRNIIINYIKKINCSKNVIDTLINNLKLIKVPYNSRRRVIFQVKNNTIGFFEKNSNNIINIDNCHLIKNEINCIIKNLKSIIKKIKNIINISITNYQNGLEMSFNLSKNLSSYDINILNDFIKNNKKIILLTYKINNENSTLLFQKESPKLTFLNNITIKLNSNVFLQATELGQNEITKIVIENLKNNKNVLDLYCGIGTYTFPLSDYCKVHSIEGNENMINILNKNIKINRLSNKITCQNRNLVSQPLLKNELNNYDGVIINPPRNGAKAQCSQLKNSNIKNIVMISCNPKTFYIDTNELIENYKLKSIIGIDQFYKTEHIEIIGIFEKQ